MISIARLSFQVEVPFYLGTKCQVTFSMGPLRSKGQLQAILEVTTWSHLRLMERNIGFWNRRRFTKEFHIRTHCLRTVDSAKI